MSSTTYQAASAAIERQFGVTRSPLWGAVRKRYLATHPRCAVCGDTASVEVHHKFPFHYVVMLQRPDLELDPRNFVTLCEDTVHDHHLLVGHLEDWKSYDPSASPDQLDAFKTRFKNQSAVNIKADAAFKIARTAKPPHLDQMTAAEKTAFKQLLNHHFPPVQAIMDQANQARDEM